MTGFIAHRRSQAARHGTIGRNKINAFFKRIMSKLTVHLRRIFAHLAHVCQHADMPSRQLHERIYRALH